MPSRVILTVEEGKLSGQKFTFEERTFCIMGRAPDCSPQLPDDDDHLTISRHHCLLDINPPDIRVRDFGSLNGTYVNGEKIGQREAHQAGDDVAGLIFPEYDLKDGDKVMLGKTTFRVDISVPVQCAECTAEIPEAERWRAQRAPEVYECEACRLKREKAHHPAPSAPKLKVCASCGRDVSKEVGDNRHGGYICSHCQANPLRLVKVLLDLSLIHI